MKKGVKCEKILWIIEHNYCQEENNLFFEKLCCFFIHIFKNMLLFVNLGFNI